MDWFAHHNHTRNDPKLGIVAKRANAPKSLVYAVWNALMECASESTDRGSVAGFDVEAESEAWGEDPERMQRIVDAFVARRHIVDGRLRRWSDRQPKKDKSAARMAKKRRRDASKVTVSDASHAVTDRHVTVSDASVTASDGLEETRAKALGSVDSFSVSSPLLNHPPSTRAHDPAREARGKSGGGGFLGRLFGKSGSQDSEAEASHEGAR